MHLKIKEMTNIFLNPYGKKIIQWSKRKKNGGGHNSLKVSVRKLLEHIAGKIISKLIFYQIK
jgi:hypothetical protein